MLFSFVGKLLRTPDGSIYIIKDGKLINVNVKAKESNVSMEQNCIPNSRPSLIEKQPIDVAMRKDLLAIHADETRKNGQKKVTEEKEDDQNEKKIWRKQETISLLELYKENRIDFENKRYKTKKEIWVALAKAFADDGIYATASQCDSKYHNLLATYKEKKDKRSCDAAETWAYMEIMDEIHGCKANINPQNLEDAGSLPVVGNELNTSSSSDASVSTDTEQSKGNERKRKTGSADILEYLREESAKREKRHEERLAVANRLADILERKLS